MFLRIRTTNKNIQDISGPMIPVAQSHKVLIHSPETGIVAFHSSPYPVHVQGGAIDIFGSRKFAAPVISPVAGEVVLIDKSKVGKSRHFESPPYDYIIAVKSEGVCARILHVEPEVEVGDIIEVSERLGSYIRTPLLPFWSYPHAHVEVKDCKDVAHPLDSFPLEPIVKGKFRGSQCTDFTSFSGKVKSFTPDYILVSPSIDIFGSVGNFHGIAVSVGNEMGLLDAQTPWNAYGGVILGENSNVKVGDKVKFGSVLLGMVERITGSLATYVLGGELGDGIDRYSKGLLYKDVGRFNVPHKRIKVNGEVFLGISTGLFLEEERSVRLVPLKPMEGSFFKEGDELEVELEGGEN